MAFEELMQISKRLSDMEQRMKQLEKENAGMVETSRQENTPKPFNSSEANKEIRKIMEKLYSDLTIDEFTTKKIDVTDIIFLMKDGTIKHFEF